MGDYASRAWAGLYAGYYLPRWTMFLMAMRQAATEGRPFDEAATRRVIAVWEQDWVRGKIQQVPPPTRQEAGEAAVMKEARALMTRLDRQ